MIKDVLQGIDLLHLSKEDPAKKGLAWTAFLKTPDIVEAARKLLAAGFHLEEITGLDVREGFVVMYAFDHAEKPGRLSLRVVLPHNAPDIPSIASVYQGAEWHEREAADFYGIRFDGNPNPTRLLLPPDMNDHPLRRKDAERSPLRAIVGPTAGECLHKDPAFTLLDEDPAAVEPGKKAAGSAVKDKAADPVAESGAAEPVASKED